MYFTTFRDSHSDPLSRANRQFDCLAVVLPNGTDRLSRNVNKMYQHTPYNNPKERRSNVNVIKLIIIIASLMFCIIFTLSCQ